MAEQSLAEVMQDLWAKMHKMMGQPTPPMPTGRMLKKWRRWVQQYEWEQHYTEKFIEEWKEIIMEDVDA